jgi:hypothetical protein
LITALFHIVPLPPPPCSLWFVTILHAPSIQICASCPVGFSSPSPSLLLSPLDGEEEKEEEEEEEEEEKEEEKEEGESGGINKRPRSEEPAI